MRDGGEEAVGGIEDFEVAQAVHVLGQLHEGVVPQLQHLQLPQVKHLLGHVLHTQKFNQR